MQHRDVTARQATAPGGRIIRYPISATLAPTVRSTSPSHGVRIALTSSLRKEGWDILPLIRQPQQVAFVEL